MASLPAAAVVAARARAAAVAVEAVLSAAPATACVAQAVRLRRKPVGRAATGRPQRPLQLFVVRFGQKAEEDVIEPVGRTARAERFGTIASAPLPSFEPKAQLVAERGLCPLLTHYTFLAYLLFRNTIVGKLKISFLLGR